MPIDLDGFSIHSGFLRQPQIQAIISEIDALADDHPKHGLRNADKKLPSIAALVASDHLRNTAAQYLAASPALVRVIVFDKTPDKNWLVTWHQDKTIAVNHRKDIPNWGPWTLKDATHHVQPDLAVLNDMITLRIHLDDADAANGCLKVIPQSHRLGILSKQQIDHVVNTAEAYICTAKAGDLLVMRPHLLHASSKGTAPRHRRIVHVEYSSYPLPEGLTWA